MCGKKVLQVQDHHIIPWYLSHDDSDSNIMSLCPKCHKKADHSFDNLILRGKINVVDETRKRARIRYNKKYTKGKQLYSAILSKYAYYYDMLIYNTKTGVTRITHQWRYSPNNHISRRITNTVINHRKRAKAAAVKGQTTLDGRF